MTPPTRRTRPTPEPVEVRLPIKDIVIGTRHRKNLGDIAGLAESIAKVDLLHPPVITPDRRLIAGERRIVACSLLGWTDIPVRIVDLDDLLAAEADENNVRLNFAPTEAWEIAQALLPAAEKEARERQGERTDITGTSRKVRRPTAKDNVAKAVGLDRRTLDRIGEVMAAAEADPEMGDLVTEMDGGRKVNGAYRKLKRRRAVAAIEAEPLPLPSGPFHIIVADPPWPYENRADDGTHRGQVPYPTMTLDAICSLPVASLSHDDAILWLWTTNAFMEQAFGVVRAWGFEPKTILTWAKERMGTGDWLRGQTEHCLMAVRGRAVVTLTNQTTLLHGPVREHSRKPDEFYSLIEALCPGSKVELFAREARDGWTRWGAEAPKGAAA
jgi:N6-adenosine-specific RNA methylase IME4